MLTTHIQLVAKSRIRGSIHPLPYMPSWLVGWLVGWLVCWFIPVAPTWIVGHP
jgi:hypothetical protein